MMMGAGRDENGQERTRKHRNYSYHFLLLGTIAETEKTDGKMNLVLQDIGNRTYGSETCRL